MDERTNPSGNRYNLGKNIFYSYKAKYKDFTPFENNKTLFLQGFCYWACQDSNLEPKDYESSALTVELQARTTANDTTVG